MKTGNALEKLIVAQRRCCALAAALAAALTCAGTQSAEPAPTRTAAMQVCMTGKSSPYSHASTACWTAYQTAIEQREYVTALSAVQMGCSVYKRTDFCMFVKEWNVAPSKVENARTNVERYQIRSAAARAEEMVTTVDIEDAERQLDLQALQEWWASRLRRSRAPQGALASTSATPSATR